jgi:hypothetical protein
MVVLLLLPFSLVVDDGEFNHGGDGCGSGSPAAVAAAVAVGAATMDDDWR